MNFVRNAWYCAGWSNELGDTPTDIKMLGEDVAMFRRDDGTAAAIGAICPHRFAPLAKGRVIGGNIECPYHGLRFDGSGACVLNPHGQGLIPPQAKVKSYPIEERDGIIWIFMGQPELADPDTIIRLDFLNDDTKWTWLRIRERVDADYRLILDNLLDLTHVGFIHSSTVGFSHDETRQNSARMEIDFKMHDGAITSTYNIFGTHPTPLFAMLGEFQDGCDIYAAMTLHLPSSFVLDLNPVLPGQPKGSGVRNPSAHLITPETEHSAHYFNIVSRNTKIGDDKVTEDMRAIIQAALCSEDKPIIEQCDSAMGGEEFFSLRPAVLETDFAAIQARRMLAKMEKSEAGNRSRNTLMADAK